MKIYTEHKLTDNQLQTLSAICNGRKGKGGMQRVALINKGLINEYRSESGWHWEATDIGREALHNARQEGW